MVRPEYGGKCADFHKNIQLGDDSEPLPVKAPTLAELKSRPCTLEELQAALVYLIDLYNEQGKIMQEAIHKKQDKEWRATI